MPARKCLGHNENGVRCGNPTLESNGYCPRHINQAPLRLCRYFMKMLIIVVLMIVAYNEYQKIPFQYEFGIYILDFSGKYEQRSQFILDMNFSSQSVIQLGLVSGDFVNLSMSSWPRIQNVSFEEGLDRKLTSLNFSVTQERFGTKNVIYLPKNREGNLKIILYSSKNIHPNGVFKFRSNMNKFEHPRGVDIDLYFPDDILYSSDFDESPEDLEIFQIQSDHLVSGLLQCSDNCSDSISFRLSSYSEPKRIKHDILLAIGVSLFVILLEQIIEVIYLLIKKFLLPKCLTESD